MAAPHAQPMSSNHSVEDVVQDQQQTPIDEQLPAYSEATKDQSLVKVFEKDPPRQQKLKASSKMSTFRSILNGDVHKHNPRYVLEESITGRPSAARSKSIATTKTSPSSSSTTSTFKSILSGDVWKHHPLYTHMQRYQQQERNGLEKKIDSNKRTSD